MLQLHDIRETRVYQEALEEGEKKGRREGEEKGRQEGLREAIVKMASGKMSPTDIARILQLDLEVVERALGRNA